MGRVIAATLGLMLALTGASVGSAYPRPGTYERVSVAGDGSELKTPSCCSSMTPDARYVAFCNQSEKLVQLDPRNPPWDVYVRDRKRGRTEIASVTSSGAAPIYPPLGGSSCETYSPVISADGRSVAFLSDAINMVVPDLRPLTNDYDLFVRDLDAGTTEMINVSSDGVQGNGRVGENFWMSGNGRYVAFSSTSTNLTDDSLISGLIPSSTRLTWQVYLRDRKAQTTVLISKTSDGTVANASATKPSISKSGRFVTFLSRATNLVDAGYSICTGDLFFCSNVFLYDRKTNRMKLI